MNIHFYICNFHDFLRLVIEYNICSSSNSSSESDSEHGLIKFSAITLSRSCSWLTVDGKTRQNCVALRAHLGNAVFPALRRVRLRQGAH